MIGNIYFNFKEKLIKYFRIPKYIKFNELSIKLTPDHLLTYFQRKYPLYNKFLPIISRYLSKDTILIDVGANCGDTLFSIFEKNNDLYFYCFEADKEFFKYLKYNKQKIGKKYKVNKIRLFNNFIGNEIKNANISGKLGTKKVLEKTSKNLPLLKSKKLDHFFSNENKSISLLKSDVDGFDYDVLNSSIKIIKKHKPIIFFECETNSKNLNKYLNLVTKFRKLDYNGFILFNNYGGLEILTKNVNVVKKKIKKQYLKKKNRYFFDILLYTQKHKKIISEAVNEFKKI